MRLHAALLIGILLAGLSGCASSSLYPMTGSVSVPAAEGTVRAAVDANRNTQLTVEVRYLAPPGRVQAGATSFVVWVKPIQPGAAVQNLGALRVNDKLSGTLRTTTALREFDVLVTAEPSSTATEPSGPVVLQASISQK